MWFDDPEVSGRQLYARRRGRAPTVLRLNTKLRTKRGEPDGARRFALWVVLPAGAIAALVLLACGLKSLERVCYSQNPRYVIRFLDVSIQGGATLSRERVASDLLITNGMNLFAFSLREKRDLLLRKASSVKTVSFRRRLPDTLQIEIVERAPVARVGSGTRYVADREGYIFDWLKGMPDLPAITGCPDPQLRTGALLRGVTMAALQVIKACDDPRLGLDVQAVYAGNAENVVAYLTGDKTVKLAWDGMGLLTDTSERKLMERLRSVAQVLQTEPGQHRARLDATYDDPGTLYAE